MDEIEVTEGMTPEDWQTLIHLVENKEAAAKENWTPAVEEWSRLAAKVRAMAAAAPKREENIGLAAIVARLAEAIYRGRESTEVSRHLLAFAAEIRRGVR